MKELLELIISNSLPESTTFSVTQRNEDDTVVLEIQVPEEFKGKIIGRSGKNISAIRQVLVLLAQQTGQKVVLKMI